MLNLGYAADFGEATFKGKRIHVEEFVVWASDQIGISAEEIKPVIKDYMETGTLESSAKGGEEVIFNPDRFKF